MADESTITAPASPAVNLRPTMIDLNKLEVASGELEVLQTMLAATERFINSMDTFLSAHGGATGMALKGDMHHTRIMLTEAQNRLDDSAEAVALTVRQGFANADRRAA